MAEAVLDVETAELQRTVDEAREPLRWGRLLLFVALLPWFGASFSYVKNLLPLWAIAKVFPIVSLPLGLVLFRYRLFPFTRQLLLTLLYMILVPSFTGMFSFHQNFFVGLTSQVKLLPMLFFFSFLATELLLDLNGREIAVGFLTLATVTFVVLLLIWTLAPRTWYATTFVATQSSILTIDDRGERIRMPMYFGMIGIFYCYRRFFAKIDWRWLALTGGMFWLLIAAVKTRAYVVGVAAMLILNGFRFAKSWVRLLLLALVPLAVAGLFSVPLVASIVVNRDPTREETINKAIDFLGPSVTHWALGVGSITPLNRTGMILFFNHFFFLADITWIGVIFEFGIIGALIFLMIPLRGIWMSRRIGRHGDDPFLGSLQDYLVFAIVSSPLTAIILNPGELTVIIGVFVYLAYRQEMALA